MATLFVEIDSTFSQIYVDINATGANNGASWANAYTDLQDGINHADTSGIGIVWVAEGIYKPGATSSDMYTMKNNVTIYGGFDATETMRSQRDYINNESILSGDLDNSNSATAGDCNHLFINNSTINNSAVFDGLYFQHCHNTDGNSAHKRGWGTIRNDGASPVFRYCTFRESLKNRGGGLCNINSADPTIDSCTFKDIETTDDGGGIYNI